jgi:hypothetical protein
MRAAQPSSRIAVIEAKISRNWLQRGVSARSNAVPKTPSISEVSPEDVPLAKHFELTHHARIDMSSIGSLSKEIPSM